MSEQPTQPTPEPVEDGTETDHDEAARDGEPILEDDGAPEPTP